MKLLVAAGVTVNESDKYGHTPLCCAKKEEVVQALIAAGADVNQTDNDGRTALFCASNGNVATALVESGANANHKNIEGETALFNAKHGKGAMVLLAAGADVNEKDKHGNTALFQALVSGKESVATVLQEAGVDVNHQNDSGEAAFIHVLRLLYSGQMTEKQLDRYAEGYLLLDNVRALLRTGLKINMSDYQMKKDRDYLTADLLFAAGEEDPKYGHFPEYLPPQSEINLKHLCRMVIRKHLLELDPHTHLFGRVPKLEIPLTLHKYLLYDQTLRGFDLPEEDTDSDYDDDN